MPDPIKDFCPYCLKSSALREVWQHEVFALHGEMYEVTATYLHCDFCGEEFMVPELTAFNPKLVHRQDDTNEE